MKEITYSQKGSQMGDLKGVLRIIGKLLYFKFNNNQYAQQVVAQLQAKGAIINLGKGWIRVDMFRDLEEVRLGEKEFNTKKTSDEEIEELLHDFYINHFKKSGFKIE